MVEVNCETDFVSRNEDFIAFARKLAQLVAEKNPADVAALSALPLDGGTVESARAGAGAEDRREHVDPPLRALHAGRASRQYLHGGGRIGVTVEYRAATRRSARTSRCTSRPPRAPGDVRPVCVSRSEVPADLIDKERAIFAAQAAESGKPAEIVAKMVEGRVNKFLAEVTLLGQPFVKNPDADRREVPEGEGRGGEVVRALRRRRRHREEEGRLRGRSGGDGEGLTGPAASRAAGRHHRRAAAHQPRDARMAPPAPNV